MSYTIGELISRLETLAETYGEDTEVRIAEQPSWPFENSIAGLVEWREGWDEDDDHDLAEAETELATSELSAEDREAYLERRNELVQKRDDAGTVIYIVEGTQLGYASKGIWDAV